ncbi:MAG: aminoglycoside 6-adenylyltransferase [Chloroflexota bacterium]|nr:aminoglycoside 6-adenylyltransferase [Chloroflexota bacterium]
MDETQLAYEQLIDQIISWAREQENVRAAIVIGSRARKDHPADRWSDLDVLILANDPQRYLDDSEWVRGIGVPWLTFVEPTGDGSGFERRVLFEGGLDVDFAPVSVAEVRAMAEQGFPPGVQDIIRRGVRILIDKDGFARYLEPAGIESPVYQPPTDSRFLNLVHDFWYHAVWAAKHLRRRELWWAKGGCDGHLKYLLQQMLEWHAHAVKGPEWDTWMRGRFLEQWADPRAVAALTDVYAHYDGEDIWRALQATMDLFAWLAPETAELLGYPYPATGEQQATALVKALYMEREQS